MTLYNVLAHYIKVTAKHLQPLAEPRGILSIKSLISFFKKPKDETKGKTPDDFYPNCWGKQEYDNQVRKMYRDKQIEINNHEANHAFIKDFDTKYLTGIHLKIEGNKLQCPTCRVKY